MTAHLYHIAPEHEFRKSIGAGPYVPDGFAREGFIHCSYHRQLLEVANRIFGGRTDLAIVEIDPTRLRVPVVDENLEGGTEQYPHVYGPIDPDAVVDIHPLEARADTFVLPHELKG